MRANPAFVPCLQAQLVRANPAFVRGIAGNAFSCLCIASQNLGEAAARLGLGCGVVWCEGRGVGNPLLAARAAPHQPHIPRPLPSVAPLNLALPSLTFFSYFFFSFLLSFLPCR